MYMYMYMYRYMHPCNHGFVCLHAYTSKYVCKHAQFGIHACIDALALQARVCTAHTHAHTHTHRQTQTQTPRSMHTRFATMVTNQQVHTHPRRRACFLRSMRIFVACLPSAVILVVRMSLAIPFLCSFRCCPCRCLPSPAWLLQIGGPASVALQVPSSRDGFHAQLGSPRIPLVGG